MSLDQHLAKLTEWDRQTGERLIKALGLPDDLRDEAMTAVNTRNLPAHRFLRERAVFFSDPPASYEAARVLTEVEVKIDEFEERLNAYMRELGIEELDESEIEALGPAEPPDLLLTTNHKRRSENPWIRGSTPGGSNGSTIARTILRLPGCRRWLVVEGLNLAVRCGVCCNPLLACPTRPVHVQGAASLRAIGVNRGAAQHLSGVDNAETNHHNTVRSCPSGIAPRPDCDPSFR